MYLSNSLFGHTLRDRCAEFSFELPLPLPQLTLHFAALLLCGVKRFGRFAKLLLLRTEADFGEVQPDELLCR